MQSGADMHSKDRALVTTEEALEQSYRIATDVGCHLNDQWLDCLKTVSAEVLLNYTSNFIFGGILDKTEFLPRFAQDYFNHYDFLKGKS